MVCHNCSRAASLGLALLPTGLTSTQLRPWAWVVAMDGLGPGLVHAASKLAECCTLLAVGYNLRRSGILRPSDGQVLCLF